MRYPFQMKNVIQLGLRQAALKIGNPIKSTLQKLSPILNIPVSELQWMIKENRLRNKYEPVLVNFVLIGIKTIFKAINAIAG